MIRRCKPRSPTWRAFLKNHVKDIIGIDFFLVPAVRNRVLFVFLILAHERRRFLHFNVTTNPTAEWMGQQIVKALPTTTGGAFISRWRWTLRIPDLFSLPPMDE